ncbi:unnamed protein product, partial [Prorocentrum cordatum]
MQEGVERAEAEVCSRASRTDRGVHALATAVCLKTLTQLGAGGAGGPASGAGAERARDEAAWLAEVQRHLPPDLEVVRWFPLRDPEFNARWACRKREYWYYVPLEALGRDGDGSCRPQWAAGLAAPADQSDDQEEARWAWLSGLPDECTAEAVRARVEELLGGRAAVEQVALGESPGSARLCFRDRADALAACARLDGAAGPADPGGASRGEPLCAVPEPVARRQRNLFARLRNALKKLTGTRSFHNFSPGFVDASDPRSMRSVYRCRPGGLPGYHQQLGGRAFAVLKITGRDFLYRQI